MDVVVDDQQMLHSRLSDISNLDLEQSGRHRQKDGVKDVSKRREESKRIVITASGFHGAGKRQFQELVASIGAIYSADLVQGSTTHLVCKRLIDCFGSVKYQRALEWGVHVVSYGWLQASSEAGRLVPEQEYMDDTPQAFNPSPVQCRIQQPAKQRLQVSRSNSLAVVSSDNSLATASRMVRAEVTIQQQSIPAIDPAAKTHKQQEALSQTVSTQEQQQTPQKLSLADLPQDYLLQGSDLVDDGADAQIDEQQASMASSISLSQYSLQLHQQHQQRQDTQKQADSLDECSYHNSPATSAGPPAFRFAHSTPAAAASVEQTSPCMQHFMPMQRRHTTASPSPHDKHSTDADARQHGVVEVAGFAAGQDPWLQQEEHVPPQSSVAAASHVQAIPERAAASPPDRMPSPASSIISANGDIDADAGCDADTCDSPLRLLIPETQAELEDPWGAAAAAGDTPVSLRYYALQQRSRTRTAAAATADHGVQEAAGAAGNGAAAAVLQDQHDEQQVDEDETEGSGSTSADVTEEPSETLSELADDSSEDERGSDGDIQQYEDELQSREPPARPWSGCSSTAQSQQQNQQPEFRLTQPSSSNDSSRRSSGLTRLKRRDGYRRMGRVLVSELPDPSELELQDSDCELDCEVQGPQEVDQCKAVGDDILEDSDCEVQESLLLSLRQQQDVDLQQRLVAGKQQQQQQQADHLKQPQKARRTAVAQQSPIHSCSASSLPGDADDAASAGIHRSSPAATSDQHMPQPASAAATPAVSLATSSSSAGAMPVLKLNFSLSGTSQCELQETGSVYTPSCSLPSSEFSGTVSTGRAMTTSRVSQQQPVSDHAEADNADHVDQQHEQKEVPMTTACMGSPLSDNTLFITRRKGPVHDPTKLQQREQQAPQEHHTQQQPLPRDNMVCVKQEPEEVDSIAWQQQVQLQLQPDMSNPAECLLQACKSKQQQERQQSKLKPAPIKLQKVTPAEQMLQDLRQRQQQLQQHKQQPDAAGAAAECIDDADSQGTAHCNLQQQQQRLPRSSIASYATDISTVSRKVPLKVSGGCEKVIGGDSCPTDGNAGSTTPLERLLQAALATSRRDSGAASADGVAPAECNTAAAAAGKGVYIKQEAATWMHTPDSDAAADLKTTAAAAAATGCDSEDDAFEITGLPTNVVAARNKAMTKQLDAHLAHLSQTGTDQVIPLKLLAKAPRGSTAKAFHGLKSSSKLVYADQVQVPWAHATLSTKEKSRCVIVADAAAQGPGAVGMTAAASRSAAEGSMQGGVFLAEPVAFYRLESGDWWLELLRFYSTKELRLLAKAADCKLHLPADFHLSYELLRGMNHEHVPMKQVQGEFKLSKVKKVPSGSRSRVNPFFWRYSIDTATCQVLTDRPVTDYVMQ